MAIKNLLTNSSVRKYLPSKVIPGFAQAIDGMESWLYDDGSNDPWWQGTGATPVRWVLTADIFAATHSSHLTRVPNIYNGLDISPGMWVFSDSDPKAVRIVSIISKTDASIQCVVEDVDRYNTFTDPTSTGAGIFPPATNLIFFELGGDGLPILNPLPGNSTISTVSQVEARFRVFNPTIENRFFQLNHGFKEGQVLKIDPATNKFAHATSQDIYIVGTVLAVGPGPHYFYLSPSTKIISDLEPGLPGEVGDVIWLDPVTGDRTTDPSGSVAALYIKMTQEVASFTIGAVDNPQVYTGTSIKLNNELITFEAAEFVDTQGIIDTINSETENHGVVAALSAPTLKVACSVSYPSATPSTVMRFNLNGVLTQVQTPSIVFGDAGQVGWWDVIRAINEQTHLHNVYATFDPFGGNLNLENTFGTDIVFENITPAVSVDEDKTVTDMLGIDLVTPAAEPTRLKLVRADGGGVIISDVNGSFSYDTGVQSAANGSLPLALVVDKAMSASSSQVVANLADMYALSNVRSGDQVFVQNGATAGEWELYVRTGETYTKIADHDSSVADASTLTVEVDFNSSTPISLGNVSDGTRIADVTVLVEVPFNSSATLDVGTIDEPDAVFTTANIDLTVAGTYEGSTSFIYEGVEDGELYVHLNAAGSSSGRARVIVSYL